MTEAETQAKQLDSVTDHVEDQEVDTDRAQQAMSALLTKENSSHGAAEQTEVSKQDVQLVMDELEVTEELATKTLRQVAADIDKSKSVVVAALTKLVTT